MREADWRLSQNPNDVNALFTRGWVRSLRCTYVAMVERAFATGFRLASKAKDDAARLLQLDPNYADAKLVVGVYQYVVGALPCRSRSSSALRGSPARRQRAGHAARMPAAGVVTSMEARTAIALFLRRESQSYKEAIEVVAQFKNQYPHDFFCLPWKRRTSARTKAKA